MALIAGVALVLLVLFSAVILFVTRYKACPSDSMLVVSGNVGKDQAAKVLVGGGAFIWPVIQQYKLMPLKPMQIDVPLDDAISLENIRVKVPAVFTVAIGTEPGIAQNAAQRLAGLEVRDIEQAASEIIFGQLRDVIASMKIEEINRDREKFRSHIVEAVEPELNKIGLVLINSNLKDLNDASGYIEAIGRRAAEEAIQNARADVAVQKRLGETRVAQAEQEQAIEVANATKLREIGVKEAERDQSVRVAELNKETAVAQQRAEFERDAQIAGAEQQKRIAVAAANAQAFEGEAKSQAQVAAAEAELQVRKAEAYQTGETRHRVAQAAVAEAEARAQAQAALAEAERIENERRAQLEAPAKAEKAKKIVEAEAEAEKKRLEAQGEASAIFARAEAEARGEYEVLSKRAEGLKQYVEAAGGPEHAYRMMMIDQLQPLAQTVVEGISKINFGKITVWDGGAAGGKGGAAGFIQNTATMMPALLQVVEEIGGVKLPTYLGERIRDADAADLESFVKGSETGVRVGRVVAEQDGEIAEIQTVLEGAPVKPRRNKRDAE